MEKKIQGKYIYRELCLLILAMAAAFIFFMHWRYFVYSRGDIEHLQRRSNIFIAVFIYVVLFALIGRWIHAFKIGVERKMNLIAAQLLTAGAVDALEVFISVALTAQYKLFLPILAMCVRMFFLHVVVCVLLIIPMIDFYRKTFPPLRVIEIRGDRRDDMLDKMNSLTYKYHVEKIIHYDTSEIKLINEISKYDAVLIGDLPASDKNKMLKLCFNADKRVYFVPKISDVIIKSSEELNLFDTPLFLARNVGMKWWQAMIKRFFDVLLSLVSLALFSPVMLIIAIFIKLEDGGPVFYRQERCTFGCKRFMILKFRSMIVDAEKDGKPHPAGENDDRITRVGHIIRGCRLDELPQLINILKGEMSIVGPRPERVEHVEKYTKEIPEFIFRSKVKGGLTGMAQVYGKYNTTALDKLKLDLIYITNYSLLLDLQIILETVKVLIQKESTEGFSEESGINSEAKKRLQTEKDEKDYA